MSNPSKNLLLIMGESTTGKSRSLKGLKNPDRVIYFNFEAGKALPFRSGFKELVLPDPVHMMSQLGALMQDPEKSDKYDTIVIDSANFMMDNYQAYHVDTAADTRAAWGDYAKFFQMLMQQYVPNLKQDVIMLAHTLTTYDDQGKKHTQVPIKGSLKNQGIEAFFSTTVATKRVDLIELEKYPDSPLRVITEKERLRGFKYVFQTDLTRETAHERIRSPEDMWDYSETFIDNDVQHVLDRLHQFYGEPQA